MADTLTPESIKAMYEDELREAHSDFLDWITRIVRFGSMVSTPGDDRLRVDTENGHHVLFTYEPGAGTLRAQVVANGEIEGKAKEAIEALLGDERRMTRIKNVMGLYHKACAEIKDKFKKTSQTA